MQVNKENIENTQYIGIDSCFLGEYSEGKWYSANELNADFMGGISNFKINANINVNNKEYTCEDIVNKKSFYLYSRNAENIVIEEKSDELFYNKEEYPEHYEDINHFRFNFPNGFGGDGSLCTTQELKNINNNIITEITGYQEYEKYIKEILVENGIQQATNINKILKADANLDGKEETYILACSPQIDENNLTDVYNLLVKIEDGKSQIIIQKIIKMEAFVKVYNDITMLYSSINSINFIDFNNDGKLELYVKTFTWDNPEIYVFNYNDSSVLELCMYGNFAW